MTIDTLTYPIAPLAPWLQRRQAERQTRLATAAARAANDANAARANADRLARETFLLALHACRIQWALQRQPLIALRAEPTDPSHYGVEIDGLHFQLWQCEPGLSEWWLRFRVADGTDFLSAALATPEAFDDEVALWLEERQRLGIGADDGH